MENSVLNFYVNSCLSVRKKYLDVINMMQQEEAREDSTYDIVVFSAAQLLAYQIDLFEMLYASYDTHIIFKTFYDFNNRDICVSREFYDKYSKASLDMSYLNMEKYGLHNKGKDFARDCCNATAQMLMLLSRTILDTIANETRELKHA